MPLFVIPILTISFSLLSGLLSLPRPSHPPDHSTETTGVRLSGHPFHQGNIPESPNGHKITVLQTLTVRHLIALKG